LSSFNETLTSFGSPLWYQLKLASLARVHDKIRRRGAVYYLPFESGWKESGIINKAPKLSHKGEKKESSEFRLFFVLLHLKFEI